MTDEPDGLSILDDLLRSLVSGDAPSRGSHSLSFLRWEMSIHSDVRTARGAIESALQEARSQGDQAATLLYRHWRLQLWIHNDGNLARALPEALDLMGEIASREPTHVKRVCATVSLMQCRLLMDPTRFLGEVRPVAVELSSELPVHSSCRLCIASAMADALSARGDAAAALATLSACALALSGRPADHAAGSRASILARSGQVAAAIGELPMAIARARKDGNTIRAADLELALARCLALAGELEQGAALLRELRRIQPSRSGEMFELDLTEEEAELAFLRDEQAACFNGYQNVMERFETLGQTYRAARAALRANWLASDARGEPASALRGARARFREHARRLLREIARPDLLLKALRLERQPGSSCHIPATP